MCRPRIRQVTVVGIRIVLLGRAREQAVIDQLLAGLRTGTSAALVVCGEAGIGKSALLDYAAGAAADVRVLRAGGVESEAELAFGALHLLLRPQLERIGSLPAVRAAALRAALGLAAGPAEDQLLVGLAVLTLLSDLAEDAPLLVLIDDAQWLDRASAGALLFAARRLAEEGVVMIFAARDGAAPFADTGLPELRPDGLDTAAAAALLNEHHPDLPGQIRDRVVGEAAGNPLALIELPGALTPERPGGELPPLGFPAGMLPASGRVQNAFRAQIERLPEATQALLLVAAADDMGAVGVLLSAARRLGAGAEDFEPAERARLITVTGGEVRFRHPLIRAAAYHGAPFARRLAAHDALAAAYGTPGQADRRAWHRAAAAVEPGEDVAAGLERTAERARSRGGYAAIASAYERAAELSTDERARIRRLRLAAMAARDGGLLPHAADLAQRLAGLVDGPADGADLASVRATVEFEYGSPRAAARTLIDAAVPLGRADPAAATSMLSTVVGVVALAGDRALAAEAITALDALPPVPDPGLALTVTFARAMARRIADHPDGGLPMLREIGAARWAGVAAHGPPRSRLLAAQAAALLGDDATTYALAAAQVAECRTRGMIGMLPEALLFLARAEVYLGRHRDAMANAGEALQIVRDTGRSRELGFQGLVLAPLAAIQGDDQRCRALAHETIGRATERDLAAAAAWSRYALGLLDLGLGRYDAALDQLGEIPPTLPTVGYAYCADQAEAAVRAGRPGRATAPSLRFQRWAAHAGQPWAAAVAERCRALTGPDEEAGAHYAAAVRLHSGGGRPFEQARTRLLYGEWLRRDRRRTDARTHLRAALDTFERLEAAPWAERARNELRATGETIVPRRAGLLSRLTPQELQVVRLAATGATNRDIAARLFLSPRTVGYHLYKAYPKLGVSSRRDLAGLDLDQRH
jgi:DNA-binding CsgD family transcriptional regulator